MNAWAKSFSLTFLAEGGQTRRPCSLAGRAVHPITLALFF